MHLFTQARPLIRAVWLRLCRGVACPQSGHVRILVLPSGESASKLQAGLTHSSRSHRSVGRAWQSSPNGAMARSQCCLYKFFRLLRPGVAGVRGLAQGHLTQIARLVRGDGRVIWQRSAAHSAVIVAPYSIRAGCHVLTASCGLPAGACRKSQLAWREEEDGRQPWCAEVCAPTPLPQ